MANFNRVILLGNLTRDIEVRSLPSGMSVADVSLAVNDRYKNQQGEWVEHANFIDCTAFGRSAEVMAQYLSKGRPVMVEGKLRYETWQDKQTGQNRNKIKVVIDNFQFVDSRDGGGGGGGGGGGRGGQRQTSPAGGGSQQGGGYEPVSEDDIPF